MLAFTSVRMALARMMFRVMVLRESVLVGAVIPFGRWGRATDKSAKPYEDCQDDADAAVENL